MTLAATPLLDIQNISKSYGDLSILHEVSLQIFPGEVMIIHGPSGTGKSTLLNLIALLDTVDSGKILIDGHDICIFNGEQRSQLRNSTLGFVFQAFHLLPEFTVLENILMPVRCGKQDLKQSRLQAVELLETLGLAGREHASVNVLSGGERQRVALCRALIMKPKLILADEPTGNLDPETAQVVLEQLVALARERQHAVIIVTHDHSFSKIADRCLRLEQHHIVDHNSV
ncbi:MAG: ABC transporter ATP-binding protein [Planctomycetes bacterium]|nr:ABC transporter ATP-binding protein [Planctomycetota bacterium]